VLTNMLLPYALTQMTADGISDDSVRRRTTAEAVAPVLTALASPDCTLNGEYIVTGGGCCAGRHRWSGRQWRCLVDLR